jgi:uncharacterized protein (TIGR02302 family)
LTEHQQRRYRRLLRLAAAALLWERLWPRLWPILGIVGAFVALALLDLLPALPPGVHALILFVLVAAFVLAVRNAVIGLAPVRRREARNRLERDSGLSHRPLTALEDGLLAGSGDPAAQALWNRHLAQMAAAAKRLKVGLPAPGMAGIEPYGLRVVLVLVLIIGVAAAGGDAGERLWRAASPHLAVTPAKPAAIDVWVTPPAYTGQAPLFLKGPDATKDPGASGRSPMAKEPITIPAGSAVLAQVHGIAQPPRLLIGDASSALAPLGAAEAGSGWRAAAEIHGGDRLAIRAGRRTLASWPLEVVPDRPPEVQFSALPDGTAEGLLRVAYEAADDYGVEEVTAVIYRDNGDAPPGGGDGDGGDDGVRLTISLANPGAPAVEGRSQHDLTFHQWAGLEVSIHLEAGDALGQIGFSAPMSIVLPERTFSHPVARAVIEQRKRLRSEDVATRESVASMLHAIGARPDRFTGDVVVSLALAVARSRLLRDQEPRAVASVRGILWDTALRIEQGTVPAAERELSEARERLQDALRSDADGDEIDMLVDELQQALDAYLQAIADEVVRQGMAGSPPMPMSQMVHGQDLQQIVEMARQLARTGARDRARGLLAELQRLVDGVRSSFNAGAEAAETLAEAQRMLSELEDLAERQEDLLNVTFDALRQAGSDAFGYPSPPPLPPRFGYPSPPPLPPHPGAGSQPGPQAGPEAGREWGGESELADEAEEQESLGRALDDLMGRIAGLIGAAPAPLGEAHRAMGDASAALRADRVADAVPAQTRAVEKLRAAAEATAQAMAEQLGGAGGVLAIQPGGYPGGRGDPFGRFGTEGLRGLGIGEVEIPDGSQLRHVDEIVRELRRRAGDQDRPRLERDYIERLLRRF